MNRLLLALLGACLGALTVAAALPPDKPAHFATQRESDLWDAVAECSRQLDVSEARLAGEQKKVATATVTVNLSCPVIPACPACPSGQGSSCLLEAGAAAVGGMLLSGAACALLNHDSVVVTR